LQFEIIFEATLGLLLFLGRFNQSRVQPGLLGWKSGAKFISLFLYFSRTQVIHLQYKYIFIRVFHHKLDLSNIEQNET